MMLLYPVSHTPQRLVFATGRGNQARLGNSIGCWLFRIAGTSHSADRWLLAGHLGLQSDAPHRRNIICQLASLPAPLTCADRRLLADRLAVPLSDRRLLAGHTGPSHMR